MTDNAATPVDVTIEERTGMREMGTCKHHYKQGQVHERTAFCSEFKPTGTSEPTRASIETSLRDSTWAFEPEKVERVDPGKYGKYKYVRAEDYDSLLALYREAVK